MKNIKLKLGAALAVLAVLFTAAVRTVDVSAIGPEGTAVGFSHVNQAVADSVGVHLQWYAATQVLGMQVLLLAAVFALAGLVQLVRRKSLWRVDPELLALACLYAAVFILYVLFEVVIINYRPILMPGEPHPEASFPSSHTMLACVILGSANLLAGRYVPAGRVQAALRVLCCVLTAVVVLGRLYSGVHWFTDICGGVLYGAALVFLFAEALDRIAERRQVP